MLIKNINPKSLTDFAQLQELATMLINIVENQAAVPDEVRRENQELRNEINRLRGEEHGDLSPKPPKSTSTTTTGNSKPKAKGNKNLIRNLMLFLYKKRNYFSFRFSRNTTS